jgi:peptidoglycan/LPS O-acetylase OafA/YrhL
MRSIITLRSVCNILGGGTVRDRLALIDGLRGIAAITVCLGHMGATVLLPHFFLAMDFFFVLSGFVIARTYEKSLLTHQLSLLSFTRVRAIRLYPLIILTVSLGFFVLLARFTLAHQAEFFGPLVWSYLFGLLLLPSFFFPDNIDGILMPWPVNPPSWSLFFEFAVNLVYGAIVRWVGSILLAIILIASGILIAVVSWNHDFGALGNKEHTTMLGFLRVTYPFFAGVAVYRIYNVIPITKLHSPSAALLISAILVMCFCTEGRLLIAVSIFIIFPVLVFSASEIALTGLPKDLCHWLGVISYPLYLVQWPVLQIGQHFFRGKAILGSPTYYIGMLFFLLVMSLLLARFYDDPVRRWLGGRRVKSAPTTAISSY